MRTDSTSGLEFYPSPLVYPHRQTLYFQNGRNSTGMFGYYPFGAKCDCHLVSVFFNVVLWMCLFDTKQGPWVICYEKILYTVNSTLTRTIQ